MIRKLLSIAAILTVLSLMVFLGLYISLKAVLSPERIEGIMVYKFQQYFHRKVDIGRVKVSFMKGELKIDNVKISEKPDFDAGVFMETGRVSLKVETRPLLKGDVIIKTMKLSGPQINIVRNKDGSYNFVDIFGGDTATIDNFKDSFAERDRQVREKIEKAAAEDDSKDIRKAIVDTTKETGEALIKDTEISAATLILSDIIIEDGTVSYLDNTNVAVTAVLENISMNFSRMPDAGIFRLNSDFILNIIFQNARFIADAVLSGDYSTGNDRLALTKLDLETEKGTLGVTGSLFDFKKVPSADLVFNFDKAILSEIVKQMSSALWLQLKIFGGRQINMRIKGPIDKLKVAGVNVG